MHCVEIEIMCAVGLPQSKEGGAPDTYFEIGANGDHVKTTSIVYHSREPKWMERIVIDDLSPIPGSLGMVQLHLRLMERPGDLKAPPVQLGDHVLLVGGQRRPVGCAWLALQQGLLVTESSQPIAEGPSVRVSWCMSRNEPSSSAATNASFIPTSSSVQTREGNNNDKTYHQPTGAGTQETDGAAVGELKLRIAQLESRIDHLDSIFRTRRDYEAEVQRIMMQEALKEKNAKGAAAGEAVVQLSSPLPSPSAELMATLYPKESLQEGLKSCQPKTVSVGKTASPYHAFQVSNTFPSPSSVAHFPLKVKGRESALQGILLDPTVVSPADQQLADTYTFKPVELPQPRMIGLIPTPFRPTVSDAALPSLKARQ